LAAVLAIASPKVWTDIVEASEFPALATQYNVYAVPKIVINDGTEFVGAQPEPQFVGYVVQAAGLLEGATPGE